MGWKSRCLADLGLFRNARRQGRKPPPPGDLGATMRRLAEICERVAATSKNLEKIAAVSDYLKSLAPDQAAVAAVFLSGRPFPVSEETTLQVGGTLLVADRGRDFRQERARTDRGVPRARRFRQGRSSSAARSRGRERAQPARSRGQIPADCGGAGAGGEECAACGRCFRGLGRSKPNTW